MIPAFRLRDRIVDPSLNRVMFGGKTIQVEPKIMTVLVALAERPGELVTREELLGRAWSGVFVTDDVLHRAIREIRRLFDDDSEQPRVIETIRKRGYRLLAPVHGLDKLDGLEPVASPTISPAGHPDVRRRGKVAVVFGLLVVVLAALAAGVAVGRRSSVTTEAHVRFVPLTSDPGNEVDPALSASGRLAYVARGDDGRAHIFTKASAGAAPLQITRGESREYAPAWSPDERRLALVRLIDGADRRCAIWIAGVDEHDLRELTPCTARDEFRMSWSPDGRFLAVTAGDNTIGSPSHIEVIEVATGTRRAVTKPPHAHAGDRSPAFSPDGRQIAFVRTISGSITDVFTVGVDGDALHRVTTDNADVIGVDWEPDGRHLVFSSDRAGGIGLWRVAAVDGQPTLLAGGGAKLKHPSVARRSGVVAYEDWQYEINLREQPTEANSGEGVAVSPTSDRWNFHPQISPDGKQLVFQSTRSGQYELWMSDRDGSHPRPLTRSAVYKSPARWSPDSRRIVFTTRLDTRTELSTIDVNVGTITTILGDSTSLVAPSFSRDGRGVYFGSLRSGDWQIWYVDLAGGQLRQITTDGGYAALESLDGRSLLLTRLDRPGLWRRPHAGGPDALVVEHFLAEEWPDLAVVDRGVFVVTSPDDGDPELAVVENGKSQPRALRRLPAYAWSGIAVSPDGATVIYAHADRRASNIGSLVSAR